MSQAESARQTRQPLTGSCHCGAVRYIVWLTLPNPYDEASKPSKGQQRFCRCNCTACQKMGIFHIEVGDINRDFLLLSPTDPMTDLGDYLTGVKELHFFFCKVCAVRCFLFDGESEVVDVDLAELGVPGYGKPGSKTTVWRATHQNGHPVHGPYLSVNAHTIDADQKSFDMRDLTEKKQVRYMDNLSDVGKTLPVQWDRPQFGGCY